MQLQRESPTPLYLQLKTTLINEINAGQYQPGQRLLSERELGERYSISRMTVRQALSELIRENWIYSRVGKGTFVCDPKIHQELRTLTGFSQDVTRRGGKPSSKVLTARIEPAALNLSTILHLQPDAEVVILSRLRFSDNIPISIETAHIPHQLCPGILKHDFSRQSLYAVFQQEYNIQLVHSEQSMEASLANDQELAMLCLVPPAPVMHIERITRDEREVVVEYIVSTYRGDRYRFFTSLHPTSI